MYGKVGNSFPHTDYSLSSNYNSSQNDNEFERYYIQITSIIPFLVKANQELSAKVDELTKRINDLENKK